MKKILLALLLCFSFVGCGKKEENSIKVSDLKVNVFSTGVIQTEKSNSGFGIEEYKVILDDETLAEVSGDLLYGLNPGKTDFYLEVKTTGGEILKSNKATLTVDYNWAYFNKVTGTIKKNGYNIEYVHDETHPDYMVINIPDITDEEAFNKGIKVQFINSPMPYLDNSHIIDCKFYDSSFNKSKLITVYSPFDDYSFEGIENPTFKTDVENFEGFNSFIKSIGINSKDDLISFCNMYYVKNN